MIMEQLEGNLANIKTTYNLFGEPIKKLSMRDRIGFLPISIWRPDWNVVNNLKKIIGDDGSTRELVGKKMALMGSKYEVSIFNPHLAQMILSAYCPQMANIFDPFGGGGTRGFIASAMGHTYTGVEVRPEEVERIHQQQHKLENDFKMVVGDCRAYDIEPEAFDFSYTCPPYYDLEVYSDLIDDMSTAPSYEEFLQMIKQAFEVTFRGLKPGSLAIWVVATLGIKKATCAISMEIPYEWLRRSGLDYTMN